MGGTPTRRAAGPHAASGAMFAAETSWILLNTSKETLMEGCAILRTETDLAHVSATLSEVAIERLEELSTAANLNRSWIIERELRKAVRYDRLMPALKSHLATLEENIQRREAALEGDKKAVEQLRRIVDLFAE
jgi:Ribbon-helix-helix protein, copG family